MIQYIQDYDERMPLNHYDEDGKRLIWHSFIYPYVKSVQIYSCPSRSQEFHQTFRLKDTDAPLPAAYMANSFGKFGATGAAQAPMEYTAPSMAMAQMVSVADTILVAESGGYDGFPYIYWDQGVCAFSGPGTQGGCTGWGASDGRRVLAPHLGTGNYLFIDGHVKALKPTATNSNRNMWSFEDDAAATGTLLNTCLPAAEKYANR